MALGPSSGAKRKAKKEDGLSQFQLSGGYSQFQSQLPLAPAPPPKRAAAPVSAPAAVEQRHLAYSGTQRPRASESFHFSESPKAVGSHRKTSSEAVEGQKQHENKKGRTLQLVLIASEPGQSNEVIWRSCRTALSPSHEKACLQSLPHVCGSLGFDIDSITESVRTPADTTEVSHDSRRASASSAHTTDLDGEQCADRGVKRPRSGTHASETQEQPTSDCSKPFAVTANVTITLSDRETILGYYRDILTAVQQLSLKDVLKNWIKAIEPKKQKNFSYNKGARPVWWPEESKYKEPDHIKSEDRLQLALSIIDYVMNPDFLEGRGLQKLEETVERLVHVFDGEPPDKEEYRKGMYQTLFQLAKAELAVRLGERDASDLITLPQINKYEKPKPNRAKRVKKVRTDEASSAAGMTRRGSAAGDVQASSIPNSPQWVQRPQLQAHGCKFEPVACMPSSGPSAATGDNGFSSFDNVFSCSSPMPQYPCSRPTAEDANMVMADPSHLDSMRWDGLERGMWVPPPPSACLEPGSAGSHSLSSSEEQNLQVYRPLMMEQSMMPSPALSQFMSQMPMVYPTITGSVERWSSTCPSSDSMQPLSCQTDVSYFM